MCGNCKHFKPDKNTSDKDVNLTLPIFDSPEIFNTGDCWCPVPVCADGSTHYHTDNECDAEYCVFWELKE